MADKILKELTLKIWRQKDAKSKGGFETYKIHDISTGSSFLEMLDILNEQLVSENKEPVAFDHDCREGICGTCSLFIDGRAHGPDDDVTTCQLHMRRFEEGATITLSNTPVAVRMGEVSALADKLKCEVIPADATSVEDLENVFKRSMEVLGGPIDFVLHSIGMSPNVRKKRTYDDLDYDMLGKTLDISAVSFHKMIQAAKKLNAIADYGSILALSYVAAQRTFYGYNDMADAKALLESIARSFGYIYGREHNVRVNTISQSPTMTTAGSGVKGMDKLFDFANRMSPLGNASADECADYCIVMFSDLTRKVTMQNLFHDGGFSSVGMSLRAMATYEKGLDEYMDENGNIIYG